MVMPVYLCTGAYYLGLRSLLATICPSVYDGGGIDLHLRRKQNVDQNRREFENLLNLGNNREIASWIRDHPYALAAFFGRLWAVSEVIPQFSFGSDMADFLVVNGQSWRYSCTLIRLSTTHLGNLDSEVNSLTNMLQTCRDSSAEFRQKVLIRLKNHYACEQIDSTSRELRIDAKLIIGRRKDFHDQVNEERVRLDEESRGGFEVVSYDRLLDVFTRLRED